jgi:hypothetical protein
VPIMPDEPLFAEPSRAESVAGRPKGRDSRPAVERNGPEPTPGTAEVAPARFVKLWRDVLVHRRLSSTAKIVHAVLVDRLGDNGTCWPGQRRIARDCGTTPKAVNRAVRELERAGLVEIEPGTLTGPRAGRTCSYRLRSRPADVPESNTLNVVESTTLANGERSRIDNVNVVESTTSTLSNRQQNQTKKPEQETRTRNQAAHAAYFWALAQAAMKGNTLRTDAFRAAWLSWVEYRRQAGKRLAPATAERQIRKLEGFGHDGAIASIEQSIGNGWQGLFDPDGDRGGNCGTNRRGRVEPERGKYARSVRLFAPGNPPAGTDAASGHEANPPARCPHT